MRQIIVINGVALVCLAHQCGQAQEKDDPAQVELNKLKGAWVEEHTLAAEKPNGRSRAESFFFDGDMYRRRQGTLLDGQPLSATVTSGTFKIDITANPKKMDLTRKVGNKEKTIHAIYQLDGEKLKLCWNTAKECPTSFEKGDGNYVLVLVRPPKPK
jgi:uncharacterized protein (TIGR03067 family)